uniref:Extracellular serine-rich protein n=1 Tax=Mycena chlorophos TaxID=658473 RepID=A0ABQ0KZV5_MYCCL|nr:predicted protein [Mycena chlorophos]
MFSALLAVSALAASVAAQSHTSLSPAQITHVITVANNASATNGSNVFTPQVVNASLGETVMFNFTQGNHSATQSEFATPCIPAHETNISVNGFDSGIRPAGNGTAITQLIVIMNPDIVNTTLWFYDVNTCGIGGVGVINPGNVSATLQTIDGFTRNAERLNGTGAESSSSAAPSSTGGSSGSSGTSSGGGSSGSGSGGSDNTSAAAAMRVVPAAVLVLALVAGGALIV